jgi:tRNA dimethylallyltransferase
MQGLDDIPNPTEAIRTQVAQLILEHGLAAAASQLAQLDPATAHKIDTNNPRRVARALEVCLHTGLPYSSFLLAGNALRPAYNWLPLLLGMPRPELYARIDQRVDAMMAAGLQAEAEALYPHRDLPVLQTVGYREFFAHLEGAYNLPQAIDKVKQNSRNYAKRQITWFAQQSYWAPLQPADLPQAIANVQAALLPGQSLI